MADPWEPLRVAIAKLIADGAETWRTEGLDISFIDWVRRDPLFDKPPVLTHVLFAVMRNARCFVELSTELNLADVDFQEPGPLVSQRPAKDYCGEAFGQLGRDFEAERIRFSPGVLRAKDYFACRIEAAVAQICRWIRDDKLRASGAPVQDGREDRAREIRPSEITESMRLGDNGWLYQGPDKDAPAWKSVSVSGTYLPICQRRPLCVPARGRGGSGRKARKPGPDGCCHLIDRAARAVLSNGRPAGMSKKEARALMSDYIAKVLGRPAPNERTYRRHGH
jgi:hypothetical protein